MWIRNKETGTIQEIHNMDVIKICQKEPDKYMVTKEYPGENITDDDLGTLGEKTEGKAENDNPNTGAEEKEDIKNGSDAADPDYDNMKINDLRKIAKEKGIQGYMNMDKATLAAVIQVH